MPFFNQKGPMGEGPMTGRKMGRCTNYGAGRKKQVLDDNENIENAVNHNPEGQGVGRGRGRGMRRGMANGMRNGMGQNRGGRKMGQGGGSGRGGGMGRRFRDDI